MSKEIEQTVSAILARVGVNFTATGGGQQKRDDWECDAWHCVFNNSKQSANFDFFTGLGHRVKAQFPNKTRPVTPSAASVLYSVLSDLDLSQDSFDDFCANLGYDTDSRKALETYLACQENGGKLRKIFTGEQLQLLREALQDF